MVRSSFNNTKLGLKVDSVLLWKKTFRYLEDLKVHFSRLKGSHMHDSPPPGELPAPAIEPLSLTSPALAGRFFTTSATWEAFQHEYLFSKDGVTPGLKSRFCVAYPSII